VALTEAGQAAFARAEEIFQIGQIIPDEVRQAASGPVVRLAVGLSDGISKLAAHALLAPVLATPNLRLVCHDGEFEQLLGELALHHLDLVLAGQAAPQPQPAPVQRAPGECAGRLVRPGPVVGRAERQRFPLCLNELPVLLPTGHSALRATLDHWFEAQGLRPRIVGEFEDSALLAVFAARGLGCSRSAGWGRTTWACCGACACWAAAKACRRRSTPSSPAAGGTIRWCSR
jgi:LysR family transcriptional activator of nhaA